MASTSRAALVLGGSDVFFDWDDPASFEAFARRNAAAWTTAEDK
jgi:hypothetical protein